MEKMKFLFGNHCHQPLGNFDFVFEDAVSRSYRPFLKVLQDFPEIRMSMHYSGCLLEWLEQHDPALLDELAALVKNGQLEMLSGGFYEPVLAAIPRWDRAEQLQIMNDYLRNRFGSEPRGAWMTERVWESHVVDDLLEAGLDYVLLDDYHFKCAGLTENDIKGFYQTENNGQPCKLFPIRESLRYAVPFRGPEEIIAMLREYYEAGHKIITMMDDGEKFGLWPGTADLCYKRGWLKKFFAALTAESDWLELSTPSEVLATQSAAETIYLPSASYFEMSEWSLPGEQAKVFSDIVHELQDSDQIERFRPYLRGGIWRNFFGKYPESNNMHKRMLALSSRIRQLEDSGDYELKDAKTNLLRAQCNCGYWHGVFGGLYLPHLRNAIYEKIIEAEIFLDKLEFGNSKPALQLADYNADGVEEVKLGSDQINAIFTPTFGGAMYELDFLPRHFNIGNSLASRLEGYHEKMLQKPTTDAPDSDTASIHDITKGVDESIRSKLKYDWHNRYSFLDHFLPPATTLQELEDREYSDMGDFVNQPYELSIDGDSAVLSRDGHLYPEAGPQAIAVEKRAVVKDGLLEVDYTLRYGGDVDCETIFAPELNFSMLGGSDTEIRYISGKWTKQKMTSSGVRIGVTEFGIDDRRKKLMINIITDKKANFWFYPAQTVSQSESGFELNYQSSVILPHWLLVLKPGKEYTFKVKVDAYEK
jgi:alpha-amylase/alpha-mannosidase (GH57 family)